MRSRICICFFHALTAVALAATSHAEDAPPDLAAHVQPLLKARCVKCHGPIKREAKLSLGSPASIRYGGQNGPAVVPGKLDESLVWQKVDGDEMPPETPLPPAEKQLLRRWILAGAPGLPAEAPREPAGADHWAFRHLTKAVPERMRHEALVRSPIDRFVLAELEAKGQSIAPQADRRTLARRAWFDLLGLPPTREEVMAFERDESPDAYERLIERLLASPRYGERWGKFWLDAAGYADSNGYFDADTDRPLAYRYRDYVVASLNRDKPWDQMVREQLAGDELANWQEGTPATPEQVELLVATHFLRNGADGSGQSDGNPDEVRVDRYSALEGSMQIVCSSLLGLTIQCARCHEHKFEPIAHEEYYQFQAILAPAFNLERWLKPDERFVYAAVPGDLAEWESQKLARQERLAEVRREWRAWVAERQPRGDAVMQDDFSGGSVATNWSADAPGDEAPAPVATGSEAAAASAQRQRVRLDSNESPGAAVREGTLCVVERESSGDRWLSTKQSFDWTPGDVGAWMQVTFDVVADKVDRKDKSAERIGYFIALADVDDRRGHSGGNILIDGNPAGGGAVYIDYPGGDSRPAGEIGADGYKAGRNYGVRVTNIGGGKYRLAHLVDGFAEEKTIDLTEKDLPDGGFGFEYCCRRSFVVDNVRVARGTSFDERAHAAIYKEYLRRRRDFEQESNRLETSGGERPGKIAWVADVSPAPEVHVLERGNYGSPAAKVVPVMFRALSDQDNRFDPRLREGTAPSTGRRRAMAEWLTRPGSRPAALLARVTVNRVWQHHFGAGLVTTPANFGYSGTPPTHPELLDWLAAELIDSGWSIKSLHRRIMTSAVYRQGLGAAEPSRQADPNNNWLARREPRRLEAEAIRDAMLAVSGELDGHVGGPYIVSQRVEGEVLVDEKLPGALRRSIYLQQRRTQVVSLLQVFDAPTIVVNCTARPVSTTALQPLALLNSEFVLARSRSMAKRVAREAGAAPASQVQQAYALALAREPDTDEQARAEQFLAEQAARREGNAAAALADLCQALLASSEFLYVD